MKVRKVVAGGHEVVSTDTGRAAERTAERTFLLVHGIGMGASYFASLGAALEGYGRVVAVDLPGFGDAPEPETSLTMAELGRVVIDFVRVEGLVGTVLVGHSMGAQVVAEAAAQRPEMFPEVVLIAPTVNVHEHTAPWQLWRMAQDLFGESPRVIGVGLVNYAKAGPRWILKKLGSMLEHPMAETLPRIRAHTLVVRGSRDRVCPRGWVEEATAMIPGATMVEVAGRGHETMVKDGSAVAGYIAAHVGAVRPG